MFHKILIANRGEIACRVIRTAKQLGIQTVAVYSDADQHALFVKAADEAIYIGASPAAESYLCIDKIIAAAKKTGAEAIHPGYGFLSENEQFARACAAENIVFIGPPIEAIAAMGSKSEAKKLMESAGVPLVPGYHGDQQDPNFLHEQAQKIGYPVLIKASAGGGGKGMRIVQSHETFLSALESCQREALASFKNAHVLIEKYVQKPRHIEIQIFADTHGNVVHLFERDCSVQRRHQKVLEEAPAPNWSNERRNEMGEAACAAARAVNYVGAGTVEFIVDTHDDTFYFMEMNTRLQVEHPVTEFITGTDLVAWQLSVAAGNTLPLTQHQLNFNGHAIEARIYAEDPFQNFLPSTGTLNVLRPPMPSKHVRIDTGVIEGDTISPFYDPMIAKLIVWDETREAALTRLAQALANYHILGVTTNIPFLQRLVTHAAFQTADLDTGLIARHQEELLKVPESVDDFSRALIATHEWLGLDHSRAGWRLNVAPRHCFRFESESGARLLWLTVVDEQTFCVETDTQTYLISAHRMGETLEFSYDGHRQRATIFAQGETRTLCLNDQRITLNFHDPFAAKGLGATGDAHLKAPMPGKIVAILAKTDCNLEAGAPLLVMEAMKMEHTIFAPTKGKVLEFYFKEGDQVQEGEDLLDFELH